MRQGKANLRLFDTAALNRAEARHSHRAFEPVEAPFCPGTAIGICRRLHVALTRSRVFCCNVVTAAAAPGCDRLFRQCHRQGHRSGFQYLSAHIDRRSADRCRILCITNIALGSDNMNGPHASCVVKRRQRRIKEQKTARHCTTVSRGKYTVDESLALIVRLRKVQRHFIAFDGRVAAHPDLLVQRRAVVIGGRFAIVGTVRNLLDDFS